MIFSFETWVLIAIAVVWILIAIIQDFRSLEVANWWNFSLIVFVLAYRSFLSVSKANYWYVLWGVIGLGIFWIISEGFYYARMFGGGDTKLLMALGTILPLSLQWQENLQIAIIFLMMFLFSAAIYGTVYSIVLVIIKYNSFKKEYDMLSKNYKKEILSLVFLSIIFLALSLIFNIPAGVWLSILILISPFLLISAKSIENTCLIRKVAVSKLTIGDWIVEKVKIGRKTIKPNWQGLSEEELKTIKKYKGKVKVKYGIPFTPAFLFGIIGMVIIMFIL